MTYSNMAEMQEALGNKSVNQLPYYLSITESKIYRCLGSGMTNTCTKVKHLKWVRNYLRKLLLQRLTEWVATKDNNNEPESTYSDILAEKDMKRLSDSTSTKDNFREFLDEAEE